MKSGICPKCGSDQIYTDESRSYLQKAHLRNILQVTGHVFDFSFKPRVVFTIDNYVCTRCGYIENYVSEKQHDKFSVIRREWKKVSKKSD